MNDYTKYARLEGAYNLSRNTENADRWSAEEWLRLYDCYKACDWDFSPDEWTERQVDEALKHGIVPEWDRYETPIYPAEPRKVG